MTTNSVQTSALLREALARFDVANASFRDIRSGTVNKHWRVKAGALSYVLRRYNERRSTEAIAYEHAVLRHLAGRGWPVAVPVCAPGGDTCIETEGRWYALFPLLPGRPPPYRGLSYSRLKGHLLARLHEDMDLWQTPGQREGFGRVWELDVYVRAWSAYGTLNELLQALAKQQPELSRAIRTQKYAVLRELSILGYGEGPPVLGHFDFNHDNMLFQRGGLSGLLDFDLVRLDERAADIAHSIALDCLAPPDYKKIDPAAVSAFVGGYTEHTPLRDAELRLIVPLTRASLLWLAVGRLAEWASGVRQEQALGSLQRSFSKRFPAFERRRAKLEAAVLQSQPLADDRQRPAVG